MTERYVELHAASAFSFLEGASQPEQLITRAAELEMPALALLDRNGKIDRVRDQLQSIVPGKLERTIELTNRSALVSISAIWAVFAITLPLDTLIEQIDGFYSSQAPSAEE